MEEEDRTILLHDLGGADGQEKHSDDEETSSKSFDSKNPHWITYFAAGVAAVGGLLFGYDVGIISGAKRQLQEDLKLKCSEVEVAVTMLPVGGFVASCLCGLMVDKFGRKNTIILNAFIFTLGSLLVCFSGNFQELLLGRFVIGYAVSVSAISECIYISEISTPELRGRLVSLNELAITIGILLAFLSNYTFSMMANGWRIMFGVSAIGAVVQAFGMMFLPRTPHFLMLRNDEKAAIEVIERLQLSRNPRQRIAEIRSSIISEDSPASFFCICWSKSNSGSTTNMGTRLAIGVGLVLFQQFTGQPNIIYYAADVFRLIGFCGELASTLASVGLGVMKVLATVVSLNLVDRLGRRKCFILGMAFMGICLLTLSFVSLYDRQKSPLKEEACFEIIHLSRRSQEGSNSTAANNTILSRNLLPGEASPVQALEAVCDESSGVSSSLKYLAFASLVGFVCAYSFSFGPLTWLILSEIFPPSAKGRAMALAISVNWLGNIAVSSTFLQATHAFTIGGVFLFYAIMCGFGIIFILILVPETKNKSLEEISKELSSRSASKIFNVLKRR